MANPLIILGAGASFDYSPFGNVAPLTNHLVEERFIYPDLCQKYRGANDLLSDIVLQVRNRNRPFEVVLTEMKERASRSPQLLAQFAALEFYLKAVFKRISSPHDGNQQIHNVNNYRTLINRFHAHTGGKASVITFNYDTLFEQNLGVEAPCRMSEYVSKDVKFFKLHGSHNWVYVQARSLAGIERQGEVADVEWYLQNPSFVDKLQTKEDVSPYHEHELAELSDRNDYLWLPAIAVPLTGKDRYVCPQNHIRALERILPTIDRVLIIGWKAGDPLLLDTLARYLPSMGYKVLVISNTIDGSEQIAEIVGEKLSAHKGQISARSGGFSGFMADDISHEFFSE